MNTQVLGNIAAASAGERINVLGVRIHMRATSVQTAGACSIFEVAAATGTGVPRHVHTREDEFIMVLEGRFEIEVGDDRKAVGPGGSAVMPRGVPHGFKNVGTGEGRALVVATPGGFEEFFREMRAVVPGAPRADELDMVRVVCAEHGMTMEV